MNFEFSEDQQMLRDVARKFLSEQCPTSRVREVFEGETHHDQALWQAIAEMGWLGIAVEEQYGGVGMGYLELCVVAEEMGRHLAPIPYSSSVYLCIEALKLAGSEEQKSRWLPQLVSGETIAAMAVADGVGVTDHDSGLVYKDGVLTGVKWPVLDGQSADIFVVLAKEDAGSSFFIVDAQADGLNRTALDSLDPSRSQSRLEFNNVSGSRLGTPGEGSQVCERVYDKAAVLLAFEQLGSAQKTLEIGVEHAKNRYAFGRPIGSFQAIKNKLADMFVLTELARSNCYYGAWALSHDAPELGIAAAGARVSATQTNYECVKESLQVHGGMGFTWQADCHLFYRRAKLLSLAIGGERVWKNKLIDRLQRERNASKLQDGKRAAA